MHWKRISDSKVRHKWVCENEECNEGKPVFVSPDWYADNGTPVCRFCDDDMSYVETEILTLG